MPTRISFVRHGNVHNPQNILYGRLPWFRLSEKGLQDAQNAALLLKDTHLGAIFSSPMLRARQTAAPILRFHPALKLKISMLINEVHTALEGKTHNILKTRHNDDVYADPSNEFEQPCDVMARAKRFISRILKKYKHQHVAAVSHGDVILFTWFWALGIEVTPENKLRLETHSQIPDYPQTGSVLTLSFKGSTLNEKPSIRYSA